MTSTALFGLILTFRLQATQLNQRTRPLLILLGTAIPLLLLLLSTVFGALLIASTQALSSLWLEILPSELGTSATALNFLAGPPSSLASSSAASVEYDLQGFCTLTFRPVNSSGAFKQFAFLAWCGSTLALAGLLFIFNFSLGASFRRQSSSHRARDSTKSLSPSPNGSLRHESRVYALSANSLSCLLIVGLVAASLATFQRYKDVTDAPLVLMNLIAVSTFGTASASSLLGDDCGGDVCARGPKRTASLSDVRAMNGPGGAAVQDTEAGMEGAGAEHRQASAHGSPTRDTRTVRNIRSHASLLLQMQPHLEASSRQHDGTSHSNSADKYLRGEEVVYISLGNGGSQEGSLALTSPSAVSLSGAEVKAAKNSPVMKISHGFHTHTNSSDSVHQSPHHTSSAPPASGSSPPVHRSTLPAPLRFDQSSTSTAGKSLPQDSVKASAAAVKEDTESSTTPVHPRRRLWLDSSVRYHRAQLELAGVGAEAAGRGDGQQDQYTNIAALEESSLRGTSSTRSTSSKGRKKRRKAIPSQVREADESGAGDRLPPAGNSPPAYREAEAILHAALHYDLPLLDDAARPRKERRPVSSGTPRARSNSLGSNEERASTSTEGDPTRRPRPKSASSSSSSRPKGTGRWHTREVVKDDELASWASTSWATTQDPSGVQTVDPTLPSPPQAQPLRTLKTSELQRVKQDELFLQGLSNGGSRSSSSGGSSAGAAESKNRRHSTGVAVAAKYNPPQPSWTTTSPSSSASPKRSSFGTVAQQSPWTTPASVARTDGERMSSMPTSPVKEEAESDRPDPGPSSTSRRGSAVGSASLSSSSTTLPDPLLAEPAATTLPLANSTPTSADTRPIPIPPIPIPAPQFGLFSHSQSDDGDDGRPRSARGLGLRLPFGATSTNASPSQTRPSTRGSDAVEQEREKSSSRPVSARQSAAAPPPFGFGFGFGSGLFSAPQAEEGEDGRPRSSRGVGASPSALAPAFGSASSSPPDLQAWQRAAAASSRPNSSGSAAAGKLRTVLEDSGGDL